MKLKSIQTCVLLRENRQITVISLQKIAVAISSPHEVMPNGAFPEKKTEQRKAEGTNTHTSHSLILVRIDSGGNEMITYTKNKMIDYK